MKKIIIVFGTRPEAIKLAPIVEVLKGSKAFDVKVLVTAQHRKMLDQVLSIFNIIPDYDLDLMQPGQDLSDVTSRVLLGCKKIFTDYKPDIVIVHGDTTTTFATSLSAFYLNIPVAHIEAGLRTYNFQSPFPEEMNRVFTSKLTKFHFTPTEQSRVNLINEGIESENILVTGNTVIDALLKVVERIRSEKNLKEDLDLLLKSLIPNLQSGKIVLVTSHRRENFGTGIELICQALIDLSEKFPDVKFVFPVHLNPNILHVVHRKLMGFNNIHLIEPLEYLPFSYLMSLSYIILTDSGGIQEEAPSLGKPVLVMRDTTERPEAVSAGVAKLVGTEPKVIISAVSNLIENEADYRAMSSKSNPYGHGDASLKVLAFLSEHL